MSNSREEETNSIIFTSLKHPIRRKILRMLSEKPKSFSEIQEAFRIESSHLTYHLENLGELVSKTQDGKYRLSALGDAAVGTMSKVEEAPKVTELKRLPALSTKWKYFFAVLMVGIVVLAGISYTQYQSLNRISAEYESLRELVDMVEEGASLTHEFTLRHKLDRYWSLPASLIYNLNDNSTLYLTLSTSVLPSESEVSINLQEGNGFDLGTNETALVIWSANTTTDSIYSVPLVSKGWYTLSLFGPVEKRLDATGKATGYSFFLPPGVDCWVDIRMVHEGKGSPFLVKSPRAFPQAVPIFPHVLPMVTNQTKEVG